MKEEGCKNLQPSFRLIIRSFVVLFLKLFFTITFATSWLAVTIICATHLNAFKIATATFCVVPTFCHIAFNTAVFIHIFSPFTFIMTKT